MQKFMVPPYYLGSLATSEQISDEAKQIRLMILTDADDDRVIAQIQYILSPVSAVPADTIELIHRSVLCSYGAEYLGLGGYNWEKKVRFYKWLLTRFPLEPSFKIKYADCAVAAGMSVDAYYPLLKAGLLADLDNRYYPTAEIFEAVQASAWSFDFDLLLLDKYYQPCDKASFDDYLADYRALYLLPEQQAQLDRIIWKGLSYPHP